MTSAAARSVAHGRNGCPSLFRLLLCLLQQRRDVDPELGERLLFVRREFGQGGGVGAVPGPEGGGQLGVGGERGGVQAGRRVVQLLDLAALSKAEAFVVAG